MIRYLILNRYPLFWIFFHIGLGLSSVLSPIPLIVWFYLVILSSLGYMIGKSTSPIVHLSTILYLISFELLARMAKTFPLIPYELGKYLLFVGMIWAIIRSRPLGREGWLMLACLLPAIFFDVSGMVTNSDLIFNILGPINVALVVIVFYRQRVSERQFSHMLRLILYPIIGVLGYTVIKAPNFNQVEFALGANVDWSGGFGSNQVSTLFGLGALLIFVIMINRWKFSGYFLFDGLVLFALSFQGLLTFSRGGMLGAVLGVLIILVFIRLAPYRSRIRFKLPKVGKYVLPGIFISVLAYYIGNELTDGQLTLRYQGETAGTLQGSKVKSINTITTGRFEIFMGDLDLWADHFLTGVGAGASRFLRETMTGTVAHVELSRLLAEHGLLGFVYFIIMAIIGWRLLREHPNPLIRGVLVAFFIVGVYTTFHAAMRTFVTPALIGLSLLTIRVPARKPVKKPKKSESASKVLTLVK